jgi:hypothetical protein
MSASIDPAVPEVRNHSIVSPGAKPIFRMPKFDQPERREPRISGEFRGFQREKPVERQEMAMRRPFPTNLPRKGFSGRTPDGLYFRCPGKDYVRLPLVESHNRKPQKGDQKHA